MKTGTVKLYKYEGDDYNLLGSITWNGKEFAVQSDSEEGKSVLENLLKHDAFPRPGKRLTAQDGYEFLDALQHTYTNVYLTATAPEEA